MLSEHERRSLEEIEQGMRAEDPTVARRLGGGPDGRPGWPWPYTLAMLLAAALLLFGLVVGLPAASGAGVALMVATVLVRWLADRRRQRRQQEGDG